MQSAPTLPAELLDHVVDHLHNDPRTLIACSLAGSPLLNASRYHLFTDLHIKPHTRSLFHLINILQSPLNTIFPFARCLVFDDMTHLVYAYGLQDALRAIRNIPRLLNSLSSKLGGVRLSNTDVEYVPSEVLGALVYTLRLIPSIEFRNVHFARFGELVDVINGFSSHTLRTVRLTAVTWTYGLAYGGKRHGDDVEWVLGSEIERDFLDWLSSQGRAPNVRRLRISRRK